MSLIGVIMLMGLVAKNAILLLDCARKEEEQGIDREEALMHAGRVRLRPILMTTFALIAGMMPVAIGVGEGGEFYRPMAVAIIGGTIVSTLLTLLVCRASTTASRSIANVRLKFRARAALWQSGRCLPDDDRRGLPHRDSSVSSIAWCAGCSTSYAVRASGGARRAAVGFPVPAGWEPRPAPWQKRTRRLASRPKVAAPAAGESGNPYAARAEADGEPIKAS